MVESKTEPDMKIGLLSDTHGYVDPKIFEHFKNVDEIWHAGDVGTIEVIDKLKAFKPLRCVYGNIDGQEIRAEYNEVERFEIDGINILMTHIGGKPGKYYTKALELLNNQSPDLFICGHSHILLVKYDTQHNMLWMNPGACGYKGFHQVKTLLRFEINDGKIENLEIIELGNRI